MANRTIRTAQTTLTLGAEGIVRMAYLPGTHETLASALQNAAARDALTGGRRLPILVDSRNLVGMDRAARLHYAGLEAVKSVSAAALVITSAFGRALGNFYLNLNKPLVPTRMFTSEDEALAWLAEFLPGPPAVGAARALGRPRPMSARELASPNGTMTLGEDRIVRVRLFQGAVLDEASARRALDVLEQLTNRERLPLLIDFREAGGIDRAARIHYAGAEPLRLVCAVAFLTASAIGRTAGNLFLRMNKPQVPFRLFTAEPEAIAWLEGHRR